VGRAFAGQVSAATRLLFLTADGCVFLIYLQVRGAGRRLSPPSNAEERYLPPGLADAVCAASTPAALSPPAALLRFPLLRRQTGGIYHATGALALSACLSTLCSFSMPLIPVWVVWVAAHYLRTCCGQADLRTTLGLATTHAREHLTTQRRRRLLRQISLRGWNAGRTAFLPAAPGALASPFAMRQGVSFATTEDGGRQTLAAGLTEKDL